MTQPVAAQSLQWARQIGGSGSERSNGIVTDRFGNIYVTGWFSGVTLFGQGQANQTTLTSSAGSKDLFIAKYDSSGIFQWVEQAGGSGSDLAVGIAVDGLGNSYVTGWFAGAATFGQGQANQTTLMSGGSDDIFVAKYDFNGVLQWVNRDGGSSLDHGSAIVVDGFGNTYVTGWFNGAATFGQGQAKQTTLVSAGSDEVFVAKYDTNGMLQFATRAGGSGQDQGSGIAVDGSGNSYVTGYFNGAATFASGQANQTTLLSAGGREMFLAKYDAIGALVWAKRGGGTSNDQGFSVAVDGFGNSYVTGLFNGTAMFGSGQPNQTTLTSAGSDDLFVAKYDANGGLQWVNGAGSSGTDGGTAIAVDGSGNSFVTGWFSGIATFDQGQANQMTLTSAGSRDVFLAKYTSSGTLQTVKRSGGSGEDQGMAIALDGSGSIYVSGYFSDVATIGPGDVNSTPLTSLGSTDVFVAKFANNSAPDLVAPTLAITSHTDGQTTTLSPILLSGTASDSNSGASGISSVTVNGVAATGGFAIGSGTATWSQSLMLSPGANLITVVATDGSVNQNTTNQQLIINFIPTVTIAASDNIATEQGPTTGMFTVSRSGGTASALTVNYTVSGTATPGSDYFPLSGSTVIPTGQSSAQIVVTPVDDGLVGEGDETVIVTLTPAAAYTIGAQNSGVVTIIDNIPITVTISATNATGFEQGTVPGVLTVSRGGSTSSALTVNYSVSGTATPGSDYQPLSGNIVIPIGQSSAQIVVTPVDDGIVEGNETVIVTLTPAAAYLVGGQSSATVTIIDNVSPTVSITPNTATVFEQGTVPGVLTVSRGGSTSSALTVNYSVSGTAIPGSDYQPLSGNIVIPIGQSAAQIVVTPVDDGIVEGNETVIVTLTPSPAYTVGGLNTSTIVIVDNDIAPGSLLWAKGAGGSEYDYGWGVAVDGSGSSYVSGSFIGTATFGSGSPNQTVLSSAGSSDLFIAKYDSTGGLQWVKRAGGSGTDIGWSVKVDASNNSYITGWFAGAATFGLGELKETTLIASGTRDAFVAKYDSNGALVWALRTGGSGWYHSLGLAVDGLGNSYVTGYFQGTTTFGQGQTNQTTLTSSGSQDVFVAKYDTRGVLQWVARAGGTGSNQGSGIGVAVDGSGNSYVTGNFSGTVTFAPGQANQTTLISAGDRDMFVAKYDSIGTLVWVKRSGGSYTDRGLAIAVDTAGNCFATGVFNGSATFGQGQATQTTLTSAGSDDIFVAKYNTAGLMQWVKRAGGASSDGGTSIALDGFGNSYVTGFFNGLTHLGSATFGLGEINQTTLFASGDRDIYVAKYDSNGILQWVKRAGAGGISDNQGMGIAIDLQGTIHVTGFFGEHETTQTAIFGENEPNQTALTSVGGADIFVAKFVGQ